MVSIKSLLIATLVSSIIASPVKEPNPVDDDLQVVDKVPAIEARGNGHGYRRGGNGNHGGGYNGGGYNNNGAVGGCNYEEKQRLDSEIQNRYQLKGRLDDEIRRRQGIKQQLDAQINQIQGGYH